MISALGNSLLPLTILGLVALALLFQAAWYRQPVLAAWLAGAGFLLAFVSLAHVAEAQPNSSGILFAVDGYAVFYWALLFASGLFVVMFSYGYLRSPEMQVEEFYLLLVTGSLGASVLAASDHFASFFLGLEILTVSLYGLIAYPRPFNRPLEAGFKYLILAATASAVLLFGMALIYGATGTMKFAELAERAGAAINQPLVLLGTVMLITGFGFKLGTAPFHMWAPDVYEGAPAPVTAFLATVSKGAVLALLLRYVIRVGGFHSGALFVIVAAIATISMFAGNLLALLQNNLKRMLAYSSIAHMGYLLVGVLTLEHRAVEAVSYYLATYFIATLGIFGIIGLLSSSAEERMMVSDYRGLFWERPWLSGAFTAMLLSLASIPLTAGFIGKFYILGAGVEASLWFLVFVIVVNSAIGLFYYLRVVVALYSAPEKEAEGAAALTCSMPGAIALGLLTLLLLWLGIYPSPFVELVQAAAAGLT